MQGGVAFSGRRSVSAQRGHKRIGDMLHHESILRAIKQDDIKLQLKVEMTSIEISIPGSNKKIDFFAVDNL